MFEGLVAHFLHKYIAKYVNNFDEDNLNIGIFSGTVQLKNLELKPEALYEFDLPIIVRAGTIGKIAIDIPWTSLYTDPVLIHLEDILILAEPVIEKEYNDELEKRIIRAKKNQLLSNITGNKSLVSKSHVTETKSFFDNLVATIANNVQISIQNVHVRYEDLITKSVTGHAVVCGFAFQSLNAVTTNNKWRPCHLDAKSNNIFKLVKLETFYIYMNPKTNPSNLVKNDLSILKWVELMKTSIFNCSVNDEKFDFVVKPIIAKLKFIFNKTQELSVPKLLADCVLQDVSIELSQEQYVAILELYDTVVRSEINLKYWKYRPNLSVKENPKAYWLYACGAVTHELVRPHCWNKIKAYRENFKKYKLLYIQRLKNPLDIEIKVDLQKAEDLLNISSILIARELAKIEIAKEDPSLVVISSDTADSGGSNSWWNFRFNSESEHSVVEIKTEKDNLWSKLSKEEKEKVFEIIGCYSNSDTRDGLCLDLENYIAHKINFTLANCTISLINSNDSTDNEREILVATLNQILASLETRPSAHGFKVSLRAETCIVEGLVGVATDGSGYFELIPIVTADRSVTNTAAPNFKTSNTNHKSYIFAFDFEKNPLNMDANYSISGQIEPIEILYQYQSLNELYKYFTDIPILFKNRTNAKQQFLQLAKKAISSTTEVVKKTLHEYAVENQSDIHFNLDIKSPYIVIPEGGALEKSCRILIIDFGRLTVRSDLKQDINSENIPSTASELEEKLYDRINVNLSDIQVLLCDNGVEWRTAKETAESDLHIIPRLNINMIFSRNNKPDYRIQPNHKLDITIAALRLNLSDRKIKLLGHFFLNTPHIFSRLNSSVDTLDSKKFLKKTDFAPILDLDEKWIQKDLDVSQLKSLRYRLFSQPLKLEPNLRHAKLSTRSSVEAVVDASSVSHGLISSDCDPYFSESDTDDSDITNWDRFDMPGFDENISPSNTIKLLSRLKVGEILITLNRSNETTEKPYLLFRVETLNIDMSLLTYGPAIQFSIRRLSLIDKQNSSNLGGYLELINNPKPDLNMVTVLYRKVKTNCPDFKSHFQQVEHSVVVDLNTILINFHLESISTFIRFISYVIDCIPLNFKKPISTIIPENPSSLGILTKDYLSNSYPIGATKFNASVKLTSLTILLSETDNDLMKITFSGFECDYIQKANEKFIIHLNLSDLKIIDESENTLYVTILKVEEDGKFLDINYVKKNPLNNVLDNIDIDKKTSAPDASLRARMGKITFTFLYKTLLDLSKFLEPFNLEKKQMKLNKNPSKTQKGTKINLNVKIHCPKIIIPQKSNSNNLLILNVDELVMENLFTEIEASQILNNILIKICNIQIMRGNLLIDINGTTILNSELPILKPLSISADLKLALDPLISKNIPSFDISVNIDQIKLALSETDLAVIIAIYQENLDYNRASKSGFSVKSAIQSPQSNSDIYQSEDSLESFLSSTNEINVNKHISLNIEFLELTFWNSIKETINPINVSELSICKINLEDIITRLNFNDDESSDIKISFQSVRVDDIRNQSLQNILNFLNPIIEFRFIKNHMDSTSLNLLIDKTNCNFSISFFICFYNYLKEALPSNNQEVPINSVLNVLIKLIQEKQVKAEVLEGFIKILREDSS